MSATPLTPEQIRNSAKFGTPLRAESMLELADRIERLERLRNIPPDDGGPAFPWGEHGTHLGGMTVRDKFAEAALIGMISCAPGPVPYDTAATHAFRFADAMLAARQPQPVGPVYKVEIPDTVDRIFYRGRCYLIPEQLNPST